MKRVFSLIMVICLLFAVAGCGKGSDKKSENGTAKVEIKDKYDGKFRVGYGRKTFMPEFGVPLAGYGNTEKRVSTGYFDELTTSCTAVSDENDNTVLLFADDIINTSEKDIDSWRKSIHEATGVPEKNIMFTASHTHSAPDTGVNSGTVVAFMKIMGKSVLDAAIEALNCRVPAKMYYGQIETEGLNFVRHYFTDDGVSVGDNHNDVSHGSSVTKHTTMSDRNLYMLKFEREGEKDVYYANFRAHATFTGGTTAYDISADFVGQFRKFFEEDTGAYISYYQGAAGNQNPTTRLEEEEKGYDTYEKHGRALADFAIEGAKNMKEVNAGEIKVKNVKYVGEINHSRDKDVAVAKLVSDRWKKTNDSVETKKYAYTLGLVSQYEANAIIRNAGLGKNKEVYLNTLAIGDDVAITYIPFEQFDTNSSYIIENSPYKYTLPQGYSNGSNGYLPSSYAYEYGCYESDTTYMKPGTGEDVANKLLEMLKELKK